ncbi:MAG: HAMP domain-containing protein [Nitrospira sp.]|nr:HAMP domain-containing protein [Nitrospira sp.]
MFLKIFSTIPVGIRGKLILTLIVVALIPLSVAGIYAVYYSTIVLENTILRNFEYELSSKSNDIEKFLQTIHRDVVFLSKTDTMEEIADSALPEDSKEFQQLREGLGRSARIIAQIHPYYYQIRYLDEKGREIVRIDNDGENAIHVPFDKLQNKGDRYYFIASMQYPEGARYVSPMDLNIEQGKVEIPHKPVLRIASPVFNSIGKRRGIIIINLNVNHLLQQIQKLSIAKNGTTFLVNKEGIYLSLSDSREGDEMVFTLDSAENMRKYYPSDVLNKILSGKAGTIKVDSEVVSYNPIFSGDIISNEYWILGIVYPKKAIFLSLFNLKIVYISIGLLSIFAASMLGIWIAKRVTKPILDLHQGAIYIAKGNLDHHLDIQTGDEIEGLAHRFNDMVDKLRASREKMLDWNELLMKEVEERTKELEIEKNKLENILMCASEGIIVADEDDKVIIMNPAAEKILGKDHNDLIGKPIHDYHRDPERISDFLSGENQIIPNIMVDFGAGQLELSVATISSGGHRVGSMMVIRDVTERQKLVEERMEMERQLLHADKLASVGELSAGIAHEIGNPLAAIKTVIQVMEDESPLVGEQSKYMKRILKEVDRLTLFIRTFSAFAHPAVGFSTRCRVDQTLDDVVFFVRKEAVKHDITIELGENKDVPEVLIGSDHLKQVLINLFVNAIQSMPEGGKIKVGYSLKCDIEERNDYVVIAISDTGPGIPEENIEKLFDPFFTTKPKGTGLGLSIVQKIIKEHQGDINVKTNDGNGTTFEVLLPSVKSGTGIA